MCGLFGNKQKSRLGRLSFIVGAFFICVGMAASAHAQQPLKIYTWSEYIDPEIVEEFEQEFNAELIFNYFESDQARDEELAAVDGRGYDLLMINSTQVERYGKRGWLEPIDWEAIPNSQHLDPKWTNAFAKVSTYAVPYFWGTMGIAYRKDLVPGGFDSWIDLFNPDEALRDKIVMISDSRELTALALKAKGHSANSSKSKDLSDARELLMIQKPFVQQYAYPNISEDSSMLSGDVWVASMYNGDAMVLQDQDENIAFTLPTEGGLIWVDYFAVAKASEKKVLAHAFLDFINRPSVAARLAEWVFYASPNLAAAELMSAEYMENMVINPNEDVLKNSEFVQPLPPRARKKVNTIGAELFRD